MNIFFSYYIHLKLKKNYFLVKNYFAPINLENVVQGSSCD